MTFRCCFFFNFFISNGKLNYEEGNKIRKSPTKKKKKKKELEQKPYINTKNNTIE